MRAAFLVMGMTVSKFSAVFWEMLTWRFLQDSHGLWECLRFVPTPPTLSGMNLSISRQEPPLNAAVVFTKKIITCDQGDLLLED